MATRCGVFYIDNGKIKGTQVHYDGYLKGGVGEELFKNYNSLELIKPLVDSSTQLSGIAPTLAETLEGASVIEAHEADSWLIAEGDLEKIRGDIAQDTDWEFVYAFTDGKWHYAKYLYEVSAWSNFKELTENEITKMGGEW